MQKKIGVILVGAVVAMISLVAMPEDAQAQDQDHQASECDRFIEAYVRSAARKMHRALANGEYELEVVEFDDPFEIAGDVLELEEGVEFEVFSENNGRIVGLVDSTRQWDQTYLVAHGNIGPIVVSQTWQARHLRAAGQECQPISSTVERPALTSSTVDIEPFQFWGLRVVWRVPSSGNVEFDERTAMEVLIDVLRTKVGVDESAGSGSQQM